MPVPLARAEADEVPGFYLDDWLASPPCSPGAGDDVEGLALRVGVPQFVRARGSKSTRERPAPGEGTGADSSQTSLVSHSCGPRRVSISLDETTLHCASFQPSAISSLLSA